MTTTEIVILSVSAILFLLICYMHWETRHLTVTHHTFQTKNKWPNRQPITFLHMSDLHLGRTGIKTEKILTTIQEHPSDFLVFTGDYFEKEAHIPRLLHLMDEIRGIYQKPIYLCYGNHDKKDTFAFKQELENAVTRQLQQRNITVLENKATIYEKTTKDGQTAALRIVGLSDARSNQEDIPALINKFYAETPKDTMPSLLITHNSDILMKMPSASVDFAVAGHTHGAQVRTPFEAEVKLLHGKDILSSRKNIIRGAHRYKEMDLYINRGLGCSLLPIRFLSKPEIAIITITN